MQSHSIFLKPTKTLAKRLLGSDIISNIDGQKTVSRIVETEAYLAKDDPACHAAKGMTKRNEAMFGPAGTTYVYLIYGMYYCFNVVSAAEGIGEAVLIRAAQPLKGLDLMKQRRGTSNLKNLASGPGKLCIAQGINKEHNGLSLSSNSSSIRLKINQPPSNSSIVSTSRIGIKEGTDLALRFYIKDNEYISKR